MLLTKSRISVVAIAIISLLLAFTLFRMAERASADNAAGAIPGAFGDNTAVKDPTGLVKWSWKASGADVRIDLSLDPTWPSKVYGVEVFIAPAVGSAPEYTQFLGNFGPFPTGQTVCFVFPSSKQPTTAPNNVGIHLIDNTPGKTALLISAGPTVAIPTLGTSCLAAEPETTPTPTRAPTATPTTKPPVTGDFTPGSGMLMGLLLAGFVLITAGGAYILQTRPSRARNS